MAATISLPTPAAPRPIQALESEEDARTRIDEYVNDFYTRRVQSNKMSFDSSTFKLSLPEFEALLASIRAYDPNNETPYELYDRIIRMELTAAEQLLCFEEIYVVTRQDSDMDVIVEEDNIYGDEWATDDTNDD